MEQRTARIFEGSTGRFHVCDEGLPHLYEGGPGHLTKAAAYRFAAIHGFTHAVGSGTYRNRVHRVPKEFRR